MKFNPQQSDKKVVLPKPTRYSYLFLYYFYDSLARLMDCNIFGPYKLEAISEKNEEMSHWSVINRDVLFRENLEMYQAMPIFREKLSTHEINKVFINILRKNDDKTVLFFQNYAWDKIDFNDKIWDDDGLIRLCYLNGYVHVGDNIIAAHRTE